MVKFKNRLKAISMFSNVGMAETYFEELGIDVVIANELLKERCLFYKHLYPNVEVIQGDITNLDIFNTIYRIAKKENVELLIATPPCQGMSCAGKKDPFDIRNNLIYYAIEMIKKLKPKFVILENVPMQNHTKINHNGKYVYIPDYINYELSNLYNINDNRIVNTKNFGIAQSRTRCVYLMVRKDLGFKWEFPKEEPNIITLKEAIGNLPSLDPELREESEKWRFPEFEEKKRAGLKVSKWHYPPIHSWKQVEWMIHTPSGKSARENEHFFPQKNGRRIKGAPRTYMRMDWNKPATTVMQNSNVISAFTNVHPGRVIVDAVDDSRIYSDPRCLTIYELLIVSSLPLNWNIPEWASDKLIREVIGEGIPPLLIKKAIENLIKVGHYDR